MSEFPELTEWYAERERASMIVSETAEEFRPFGGLTVILRHAGNTLVAAAIALTLCILASLAHANPSPADMGLDKSAATGNLSVLDRSGTWVSLGAVNSTAHALAIPNASLANPSLTVGGASCALGGNCAPSTTIGATACGLGGSCAPSVTVNGTPCVLGSTCAPSSAASLIIGTSPTSGGAAGQLMFDTGSVLTESATLVFTTPTLKVVSNTGALALGTAADTILTRDAANAFGQRNGTTAQLFSVYNTFTSATSYERAVFDWQHTANVLTIGEEVGSGGGSGRGIQFVSGPGSSVIADWGVTNGHWTFAGGGVTASALTVSGATALAGLTAGATTLGVTNTGTLASSSLNSGGAIIGGGTISAASNISNSAGNITALAGSLVAAGAVATVTTGQIGYSGQSVASSACGSLATAVGCFEINVAGVNHFVPYY